MTSINQAIKEKSHKEKQCRKHQDKISRTEEEIATLTRQPHGLNRESKNALQCEITNKDIEKAEMEVCKSAEQLKKSEIAVNEAANAYQEATQEKKNAEEKAFELSDAPSLFTKLMDAVLALLAISKWLWAYVKWKTPKNKLLNARLQLKVKTINQTNTKTTLGVAKTNVLRDTVNLQTAQSILEVSYYSQYSHTNKTKKNKNTSAFNFF